MMFRPDVTAQYFAVTQPRTGVLIIYGDDIRHPIHIRKTRYILTMLFHTKNQNDNLLKPMQIYTFLMNINRGV